MQTSNRRKRNKPLAKLEKKHNKITRLQCLACQFYVSTLKSQAGGGFMSCRKSGDSISYEFLLVEISRHTEIERRAFSEPLLLVPSIIILPPAVISRTDVHG